MQKISILVVDDHTLIREMWVLTLQTDPSFKVIAETGSGEQAVELARQLKPDIVLMDINLPGINGIEATQQILKVSPGTKIIAISLHTHPMYARQIMKMGAVGYVCKCSSRSEMFTAIREVQMGRKYICDEIRDNLSEEMLNGNTESNKVRCLTRREIEIIGFVKMGQSSKQIADRLHISLKTVEAHRYNILKKLELKNSSALVNFINKTQLELNPDHSSVDIQPGINKPS